MTDTDALTERIARELFYTESPEERHRDGWLSAYSEDRYLYRDLAAAVLPIVAEEVRKTTTEALREAAENVDVGSLADSWTHGAVTRLSVTNAVTEVLMSLRARATEYETGGSDEHR